MLYAIQCKRNNEQAGNKKLSVEIDRGRRKKRLQQTLVGMMSDIHAVCQKHEISRTNVQNTMERTYLTTVLLMVFLQEHSLKNRVLKMNN